MIKFLRLTTTFVLSSILAAGCATRNDLYGYCNKDGEVVIPRQFQSAEPFSNGLAAVKPTGFMAKYGFIDHGGKFVIKPQFTFAENFSEDMAAVCTQTEAFADHHNWGYIDKTGKLVVQPQFHKAMPFSEGLACVTVASPGKDDLVWHYGFIDKTGKWALQPNYSCRVLAEISLDNLAFSEGLAQVYQDGKVGFMDKEGKIVIKPQFQKSGRFSGGLAPILVGAKNLAPELDPGALMGGKWGLIDRSGKVVLEPAFDAAYLASTGKYHMSNFITLENPQDKDECLAFLDSDGKLVRSKFTWPEFIHFPADKVEVQDQAFQEADLHEGLYLLKPVENRDQELVAKKRQLLKQQEK